ncbi:TlpA family protein disulfide reductase [Crocinitomix algicola]|uniref:TlpA family protein disulfide reductase n=1 Tax=Crocinitomix algicola TaxID=1740263 RepID=UPI0009F72391|nr:TlpA disulfide reductase family protein [Crocinitomix algicola]
MKKIKLPLLALIASIGIFSFVNDSGDTGKKMPSVQIQDIDGNSINTGELSNDGNPIIVSFWATWCKPCRLELNTIAEEYDDLVDETGVKLVAVSIDDERNKSKVRPVVDAAAWDYEIWLDPNSDLKRAMGVNYPPQTFLLDGEGNIVYSHVGYVPGDEQKLYDEIYKLTE